MTVIGVLLIILAAVLLLIGLFAGADTSTTLSLGGVHVAMSAMSVFLMGAATVLILVAGLEMLRSGLRRSLRRRRELKEARALVAEKERRDREAGAGPADIGTSDTGTSDTGTSDTGTSDTGTSAAGTAGDGTAGAGTAGAGTATGTGEPTTATAGTTQTGTSETGATGATGTTGTTGASGAARGPEDDPGRHAR